MRDRAQKAQKFIMSKGIFIDFQICKGLHNFFFFLRLLKLHRHIQNRSEAENFYRTKAEQKIEVKWTSLMFGSENFYERARVCVYLCAFMCVYTLYYTIISQGQLESNSTYLDLKLELATLKLVKLERKPCIKSQTRVQQ